MDNVCKFRTYRGNKEEIQEFEKSVFIARESDKEEEQNATKYTQSSELSAYAKAVQNKRIENRTNQQTTKKTNKRRQAKIILPESEQ